MPSARPGSPTLDEVATEAANAWPGIGLDSATFIAYVRERAAEIPVGQLHAADLFLACACVAGVSEAWRELDRRHLARVPEYIARVDRSPGFADDVRQRLAIKLSGAYSGATPKLALYTGRGTLASWLRIAAIREAQRAKRGSKREGSPEQALHVAAPGDDPEVRLMKEKYATDFKRAFGEVLLTLSSDERNVLRLHYLDGLSIDEVGKVYRVSRATAARWLARARATIVERVRESLGAQFEARLSTTARVRGSAADPPSPASILAFVRSQLDISLRRHFTDDGST
jgi:RNA polymerase sigma-70 factor, ECF subfamily